MATRGTTGGTATGPTATATTGAGGPAATATGRRRLPQGTRTVVAAATSEEMVVALEKGWDFLREIGFFDFWQRAHGESLLSAKNFLEAVLVVVADLTVQHVDPFKGTRAENVGVHIIAAILFIMLLVPGDPTSGRSAIGHTDRMLLEPLRGANNRKNAAGWLRRMGRGKRSVHEFLAGADEATIRRWIGTPEARREFIQMIGIRMRRPTLAQEIRQFQRDVQRDWAALQPALRQLDLELALALVPMHATLMRAHVRMEQSWATRPPVGGYWIQRGPHEQGWSGFWRYVDRLFAGK